MSDAPLEEQHERGPLDAIGTDIQPDGTKPDNKAHRELAEFGKDYEVSSDKALEAQNYRDEATRHNFHRIFILGLRVVGFSLIIVFVVRMLHVVLPDGWHWLTSQGLQEIDRMLFSGAAGGLIIKYLEPILNGKKKP